jgi:hypothetical protein
MAAIIPISDRRARLSLILALLGMPSLGVTLPAAVWLGSGAVRQQRLASGAEPAMGFLALVISGIDVLFVLQIAARSVDTLGPPGAFAVSWGVGLAAAVLVLALSSLRTHPERTGTILAIRAAMIASVAGGTGLLAQLLAAVGA